MPDALKPGAKAWPTEASSWPACLRRRAAEFQTICDGPAAIEAATSFQPDLALLDIGMPKLNGYEVARRIRAELGNRIVLVAITGWGQEEDKRRAMDAGFDHHMTK